MVAAVADDKEEVLVYIGNGVLLEKVDKCCYLPVKCRWKM